MPIESCFIVSKEMLINFKVSVKKFVQEVKIHIQNVELMHGKFIYAPDMTTTIDLNKHFPFLDKLKGICICKVNKI